MHEDRSSGGRRVAAGNFVTVSTNAGRSTAAERTGERRALECTTGDPVLHPCSRPCYPVLLLLPFLYLFLFWHSLSPFSCLHHRAVTPRLVYLQSLATTCILASSFLRHCLLLFHDLAVTCTWFIAYIVYSLNSTVHSNLELVLHARAELVTRE